MDVKIESVLAASKFIRTVVAENVEAYAVILNAEANILTNQEVETNLKIITEALEGIKDFISDLLIELKPNKEEEQ